MGMYVYGLSKKSIPTPLGPVHVSHFLGKLGTYGRGRYGLPALGEARKARVQNSFTEAPELYVFGDPRDFVKEARETGRPTRFGIMRNEGKRVIFNDTATQGTVVGWFTVEPTGKIAFTQQ